MEGVGEALLKELEQECTAGDPGRYVRRRVALLLDEMAEFPDSNQAIARTFHRAQAVNEKRKQMEKIG